MLSLLRLTATLLFGGFLIAGYYALQPRGFAGVEWDVWELPALVRRLHHENLRQEDLARKYEQICYSRVRKEAAIEELIAGRLTLVEAVERIRLVAGETLPELYRQLRGLHPNAKEEELLYLHVIGWTDVVLEHQPARRFAAIARLQLEWRAARL